MRKLFSALCAATLAGSLAVTAIVPASAGPVVAPRSSVVDNGVINVQSRMEIENWQRPGRQWRGDRYRGDRWSARRDFRRGDGFYNGHRGFRYKRNGYRYHNGWWFPAGAFVAGAIIGNAINNSAPVYRERRAYGGSHVQWCYDRYRSYREWDNTFQPYNGPRQQCYSPYS